MNTTKPECNEVLNKITLHRLNKALKGDEIVIEDIENMCLTMYKMGISPLTTVRKYLGKYDLGNLRALFVSSDTCPLNTLPPNIIQGKPAFLVFLKETKHHDIVAVKIKYYPALSKVSKTKYKAINFTSITLK